MGIFDSITADPLQQLLTALGCFQRELARAEEGVERDHWFPPASEQIQLAEGIAREQRWGELSRTLGDLVRLMEAFDRAEILDSGLPLLKAAYETLCLMVGDQIVGKKTTHVVKQWDRLYENAAETLANAGVELAGRPARPIGCVGSDEMSTGHARRGFLSVLRRIFGSG